MQVLQNFHHSGWGVPSAPIGNMATGDVGDATLTAPDNSVWERWTTGTETTPSAVDAERMKHAKYLASIPTTFIKPGKNNPHAILRDKQVRDFNLFMMNHPWRKKGIDDMEDENKEAYDNAYKNNPQHVADKRAFEEAEARINNKNSILKAVMTDPGMALLDYENKEPDQVRLLQRSNQSYVSSRDKYFVPPRPLGERTSDKDDAFLSARAEDIKNRLNAEVDFTDPLGTL